MSFVTCLGCDMQFWIMHLSFANFTFATLALTLMLSVRKRKPRSSYYEPILFWLIHAWVFWGVIVFLRVFNEYHGPTEWATTWNSIVQLHAFIGIAGLMAIKIWEKYRA